MSIITPTTSHESVTALEPSAEALTVAIIDQSDDVREFARDAADARLTTELNSEAGGFRKIVRNIWKGNLAREYYRQRYIIEARTEIVENDDLYTTYQGVEDGASTRARMSTIDRFVGEYEGAIHESAGENRRDLSQAESDGEAEAGLVTGAIKGLISEYAEGRLDDDTILAERTRILKDLRSSSASDQLFGEGVMMADNILEIAQNVKAAIDHGESIDRVMEQVRVISGESRSGARTEAQYNKVDRIIEKISGTKAGLVVNEAIIATAVSVAASIARFGSTKLASAATMTIAPGIGAGLVAGLRENKIVKDERRQHAREMATGQEYDRGNAKRRDAMQESLYGTVTAESLIDDLTFRTDPEQLDGADESILRDALASVLSAQSRIRMSDSRAMDLISYSSVAEVETERLVLDIALAQAKCNLQSAIDVASEDVQRQLGFDPADSFSDNIFLLSEALQCSLEQDVNEKDAAFKSLKRREVAKTTAKAALIGMGMGMVAQEIKAMIDPGTQGYVEQLWHAKNHTIGGRQHESLMYGLLGSKHGSTEINNHILSGNKSDHVLGHGTKVSHSSEYGFHGGNGHYELIDPKGHHINGIEFDTNGALTPESIHKLQGLGLTVHDKSTSVTELITTHRTGNVDDFLSRNQSSSTHVTRNLWYDNNTPAPKFDKNELGLQWGGAGNSGLDEHGNYIFNTHAMTANGSFHGSEQAHWQELAAEGKLKMAFSATKGSQNQVFEVPIDANGNAVIPKGSPIAQMFTNRNGNAVFEGKYAEVVQSLGKDTQGTEHVRMLATHIGEDTLGKKPFDIVDVIPKTTTNHVYDILGTNYSTTQEIGSFIEMAPVIPVYGRKSLENLLDNRDNTPNPYYFRGRMSPEEIAERRRRFSPRLAEDPDADLDQRQEVDWYLNQQDPDHIERIRSHAESIPEPMGSDVKVVVTIPVAGHQEADNIYRTLSAYSEQTLNHNEYEMLLYVNHPESDADGNQLNANETLAEIERFKRDHPEMPIRVIYEALPREKAKIGYIRKVLVDTVLQRQQASGNSTNLVILSNDADSISINPKYLEVMLREMGDEEEHDAVVGQIVWDDVSYVNYPEVHIGTKLFQFIDISLRNKEGRIGATSGANSAFSAAIYAAVGGYDDTQDLGEDVVLGRDFIAARDGTDRDPIGFGGVVGSRIETSARRSIYTWFKHNDAPYKQWNYSFGADDDDVRGINVDKLIPQDLSEPERAKELINGVEHVINLTLEEMNLSGPSTSSRSVGGTSSQSTKAQSKHVERALHFMGIDFEWDGSYKKIKITDASKMIEALQKYSNKTIRKELIKDGVPTDGGMIVVDGKIRKANGQFMSRTEQEAIRRNLPKLFGQAALVGS